jgi:glycogenin glucosyltransferase
MNYTFVTYLGTDNFLPGVLALNESLSKYNKNYGLLVLITENITRQSINFLEAKGLKYKTIQAINNPHQLENDERNFKLMFTKLRIFELYEYDKVVYIDADMLVCNNIEELFNHDDLSAVVAGGLYPGHASWIDFNAGFLVVEPNEDRFNKLIKSISELPSKDGGDQGFLNVYYGNWPTDKHLHLEHRFNVPSGYIDEYCKLPDYYFEYKRRSLSTNIAIIHYWGKYKPWEIDLKILKRKSDIKWEQSLILWWDVFEKAINNPRPNLSA